ncbi:hypothetical protein HQO24_10735 [Rhodococcus fascians]|uniref:hypothetical protein n=1 Tax=unclassified Rhodococcus (in: high G+C Gram-positive bacteria) TaxID=192944 RepID=UPI0011406BFA|nr:MULTISPECIES: hypothetical protein [unclassified Rhodococcus (in: high G+C Gram-positive bacteria)]MBY4381922.1 hypothetical protein [Rhodococcus fascians]MBY4396843.1 hypothetical protein [Rhodococcus fascians]MBY4407322.1 hypothetical protein [Rhodococcus fascians]MBY4421549.1 hypothetical protein [Rhodococcus fascians]MBY4460698.1 hypothetical protein [Rhodococcus fascians]
MSSFGAGGAGDWYSAEEYSAFQKMLLRRKSVGKYAPKNNFGFFRGTNFTRPLVYRRRWRGIVGVQREFTCSTAVHADIRLICPGRLMVQIERRRNQSVAHNRLVTQGDEQ